ncbi:MAG: DUF5309 domain-containing protein [Campylobacteraceae bacterium]|jgi:hypothetical protein|nr:DUF5309 domain-containing protein [Campylobacteraceae bacterium]
MPILKTGLVDQAQVWGKEADLERVIKETGFKDTPFLSLIPSAAPIRSGKAALGHAWFYDDVPDGDVANKHLEGGAPAPAEYFEGGSLLNHYQIVKNTYGVTGSNEDATRVDGKLVLTDQFLKAKLKHVKSIEQILLSDQPAVQRVNAGSPVEGQCAGLKAFATVNNTIDTAGDNLSWKLIRELLKIGWRNGGTFSHVFMNSTQKDVLDDILFSKAYITLLGTKTLENNVTLIGNTPYGSNIKVVLSPYVGQNEIIAIRPQDIYKVNLRPMKTRDILSPNDIKQKEIISEFTLRVCTPFAFALLSDLGDGSTPPSESVEEE